MSDGAEAIKDLFESAETDFLLSKTTVTMKSSLENIEVGDFKIDSVKEGETLEVPRWVAEELALLNMAESTDEPFETEMYKALSREKMMGPFQLSSLPVDFYIRMRRRLAYLSAGVLEGRFKKEDYEKVRGHSYDLVGMRLGKLISIAGTSTGMREFEDKITPEEKAFFGISQTLSRQWKDSILKEGA